MEPEPADTSGLGARALAARAMHGAKASNKAPPSSKYGNMNPKAKLISKDVKYFDSADWALQKEGAAPGPGPVGMAGEQLQPKLEPTLLENERKTSQLSATSGTEEVAMEESL